MNPVGFTSSLLLPSTGCREKLKELIFFFINAEVELDQLWLNRFLFCFDTFEDFILIFFKLLNGDFTQPFLTFALCESWLVKSPFWNQGIMSTLKSILEQQVQQEGFISRSNYIHQTVVFLFHSTRR